MKDSILIASGALLLTILFSFLISYPVMLLWNGCLVPATTILKEVSWLQMWGIAILFNIVVKSRIQTNK